MFILPIAIDLFWRFVWNIYQHKFSSPSLWILRFFTFVWFLHWVIKLVFQSITTAFSGLGYLSVCHHLRNTAHENILLKLPKWELWMAQLVLFCERTAWPLPLWGPISLYENQLLVSCWRNWVYNWKKSNGFYFHTDVSVTIESSVKGKLTTVLLSTVVLDGILAPLNWSWGSFLMCRRIKNSSSRLGWWNGLHI